jgi:hypothetical protein
MLVVLALGHVHELMKSLITISGAIKLTIHAAEGPPVTADDVIILNLCCLENISAVHLAWLTLERDQELRDAIRIKLS